MDYRILGALQVLDGGVEVALGAAKPRALLVRLLLDRNRPIPAERLVEDLWEGDPPRSAAQTLQTYVSQLRKAIGPERLLTHAGSYRLLVDDEELDVTQFETELSAGRAALRAGDARSAVDRLGHGLAHWRGPALADAAGAAWAVTEAARLEELRLVATETVIEARLALGEHRDVIAVAEAAVAEHPLREPLWALLMTALYRDGRQADALRAFQRLRHALAEELGIDPSSELQDLEAKMLRQEAELQPHPQRAPALQLPSGVVTFLLTDVVSSTRLWEIAASEMAGAVDRHEQLLRRAVERHNGVFLKHRGEGDSTFSVFPRATDAVAAAAEAQQLLADEGWPTPEPFEVRIAIHTGEALERDGDYYGRTVNRAARLRAAAVPRQVLVSQATAELVIDDLPEGHRLVEMGVQELRDLDRPETVFSIVPIGDAVVTSVEARAPGVVPLPTRLRTEPILGFAGRVPEREVLDTALKHAAGGTTRVVLVAGEPGIGKTALAGETARTAHATGAVVLFGRCDEDGAVPYRAWVEALGHYVAHAGNDTLAQLGPRQLGDLARLIPAISDRVPGVRAPATTDLDADRWALFTAVAGLMTAASVDAPVMLVLDDLQWADKPTLLLLQHVIDTAAAARLLIVGTYRDSELSADHPLTGVLAALRREPGTERVTLRGLADHEVVRLLETRTGRELEPDALEVVHAVYRETDGNPFFATELIRHLAETGAMYLDDDGRWVPRAGLDEAGLPDSVREVMDRRVAHLGEECVRVLQVASVVGHEFDLATVAHATSASEADILEQLEAAEAAGLLTNLAPGRFAFAHTLVAHTQYAGVSPTRRALLHRAVAEAIEALDPSGARVAELARHWAAAASPDAPAKAIEAARAAGDRAMQALAPDDAVRWYGSALDLLVQSPDDAVRCDLLIRLGRAQRDAGDLQSRTTLLDAAHLAQRIGDHELLIYAALANSTGYAGTSDETLAERTQMLEAALAVCESGDSPRRARLLATLATESAERFSLEYERELCDEAISIARRLDNPLLLARVLNLTLSASWHPATLTERLARSAEAVELATQLGGGPLLHWAAMWRVHALVESGDVDGGARWLDEMARIAAEVGYPALQWSSPAFKAALAVLHGDTATANQLGSEAIARAAGLAANDAELSVLNARIGIARHRGASESEWGRLADEQLRWAQTLRTQAEPAMTLAQAGRTEEARQLLADDLTNIGSGMTRSFTGFAALWGELCVMLGTQAQARIVYDALSPYHDQVASTGARWDGAVAGTLGMLSAFLGRDDEADQWFAEAEQVNELIRAPYHLARHRVAWAKMLLARGQTRDADHARDLLTRALAVAREYECDGVVRDAEALLATPLPLPPRIAAAAGVGFVGRDDELATIAELDRGLVLVAGEPGIGKSALVATAAAAAHAQGAWVLYGRCDEELRVPYRPFVEALGQLVDQLSDSALDTVGDRHLAELTRLVPAIRERRPEVGSPQPTDPDTERYLLMNAAVAVASEAARHAPVVFVIDDLQWADKPTLVLLRHLLASAPESGITVLATYRQTDVGPDTPLADVLPTLRSEPAVHHLALSGLTVEDVLDLTRADAVLAAALHRETGGNPLFATELFRHLNETGADLDAGGVPETVRGLVVRRVARLGDEVRSTLVAASVIGQEFDLALLSNVLDLDIDSVIDGLEQAETAALVQTIAPARFAFAHTLVQHSLYGELAPTRRARLHLAIAAAIESLGLGDERITELARHAAEGAVATPEVSAAVRHARAAGDRALNTLAPDEAVHWYRRALELQQRLTDIDDHQRGTLLLSLARAQLQAGDQEFRRARRAAAELAMRLDDTDMLVGSALVEYQRGFTSESDPDVGWLLTAALERIPDDDTPARARLLARAAYEAMFTDSEYTLGAAAEAIGIARRLDDPHTLADVLSFTAWATPYRRTPDWLAERIGRYDEVKALADELGDPATIFTNAQHGVTGAMLAGDFDLADQMLATMVEIADEIGRPDFRVVALDYQAYQAVLHGDLATGEHLIENGRALAEEIQFPGQDVLYASTMYSIRWHQGRQSEVAGLLTNAAERHPDLALLRLPPTLREGTFDDDLTAVVDALPDNNTWHVAAAAVADIIGRRGDAVAAARLYDELLPLKDQFVYGGPTNRGAVAHSLGVLAGTMGNLEDADAHFAAAAAMHERINAPFFLARTLLEWSGILSERAAEGDAEKAMDMLIRAQDVARRFGYAQIERRADRALSSRPRG
jgi:predicted ATPase/DNA-binding SARP family transcriptional activator